MALSKDEMRSPHPDLNALAAFIDHRLSEADRTVCIDHLNECAECRTLLATYARGTEVRPRLRGMTTWLPLAATLALVTTAGVMVWRMTPSPGITGPASPTTSPPLPTPPTLAEPQQPPTSPAPVRPNPAANSPGPTRSGERIVGGRVFQLVAGEWIDSRYDPLGLLPVVEIDAAARADFLTRVPALAPYAALGPRVVVVHEGVVYRFR